MFELNVSCGTHCTSSYGRIRHMMCADLSQKGRRRFRSVNENLITFKFGAVGMYFRDLSESCNMCSYESLYYQLFKSVLVSGSEGVGVALFV